VRGDVVSEERLANMFSSRHTSLDGHASYGVGVWLSGGFYPCGSFVGHDGAALGYLLTAQSNRDRTRSSRS
jgi:hypothetical protein